VDAATIGAQLEKVGVPSSPGLPDGLLKEARHHVERLDLEDEQAAVLHGLDVPLVQLEQLGDGVDLAGLHDLADSLRKQDLM
jgi:hypothetical protein